MGTAVGVESVSGVGRACKIHSEVAVLYDKVTPPPPFFDFEPPPPPPLDLPLPIACPSLPRRRRDDGSLPVVYLIFVLYLITVPLAVK